MQTKHELFFSLHERWNYHFSSTCSHQVLIDVIFHHYSWVRTKSELLLKTKSWAHKNDKNWNELIEIEFLTDFSGTDPINNYNYKDESNSK